MLRSLQFLIRRACPAIAIASISACSPTYDWREVRGTEAPYVVLLPAKPSTHTRPINLDGLQVKMTMTAAEVNGVTFAVGTAKLPDEAAPTAALNAMKTAMVRNIGGTIRHEKSSTATGAGTASIEIEAAGTPPGRRDGQPRILFARFAEKNRHIYQAVVLGKEKDVNRESVETFLTSFKPN